MMQTSCGFGSFRSSGTDLTPMYNTSLNTDYVINIVLDLIIK